MCELEQDLLLAGDVEESDGADLGRDDGAPLALETAPPLP